VPVFTGRRILEVLALGASVEVDLVIHGGNGFAVLHDHEQIGRETTGTGPARAHSAEEMRALHLRGNDGTPIADHVMLLEDLCALLQARPPAPDALLQPDFKENQGPPDPLTHPPFPPPVTPGAPRQGALGQVGIAPAREGDRRPAGAPVGRAPGRGPGAAGPGQRWGG